MAVHIKVANFTKPVAAAPVDQTISWAAGGNWPTNTPVQALLLWSSCVTVVDAFERSSELTVGLAAAPATGRRLYFGEQHGGAYGQAWTQTVYSAGVLITGDIQYPYPANNLSHALAASYGVNAFTLTWSPNHSTARIVHAMAFGGLTGAALVSWNTSAGVQDVSGVGFCPDLVFHLASLQGGDPAQSNGANFGFGVMNGGGEQWAVAVGTHEGGLGSLYNWRTNTARFQSPSDCLLLLQSHQGAPDVLGLRSQFVATNPDGFSVNNTLAAHTYIVRSLCLTGIGSKLGSLAKSTGAAPATQTQSGLGLDPKGLLLASVQDLPRTTPVAHDRLGVGAFDGASDAATAHVNQDDHTSPNPDGFGYYSVGNCWRIARDNRCFVKVNNSGIGLFDTSPETAPTIDALANGAGFGSGSFELTWDPNDAVATELLYAALGEPVVGTCAAVPPPPIPPTAPGEQLKKKLCLPLGLPRAEVYSNPGNPADILPIVYGSFATGGLSGPIPAVLINKGGPWVYCAAAHPSLAVTAVYIGDIQQTTGYEVNIANDYQGQGAITTITFDTQPLGAVSWRGSGRLAADGVSLLENAAEQIVDLLTVWGSFELVDIDAGPYAEAIAAIAAEGYTTAFVVNDEALETQDYLTEFLFNVMGTWRITGAGLIQLQVDRGGAISASDIAASVVAARDCLDGDDGVSFTLDRRALVNALTVQYQWAYAQNQPAARLSDLLHAASKNAYSELRKEVTLRGLRDAAQVRTWAETLFERQSGATRVEGGTVAFVVTGSRLAHLTVGDVIAFTWPYGPTRENGNRYVNELLRVVECIGDTERGGAQRIVAVDLGQFVTSGGTRLLTPTAA